ncbi:MAG: hypothetical protein ACRDY5_09980 [Acidimicrobiales bacterium]
MRGAKGGSRAPRSRRSRSVVAVLLLLVSLAACQGGGDVEGADADARAGEVAPPAPPVPLTGADDPREPSTPGAEAAVRAALETYRQALLARDGDAAAAAVTTATLDYFAAMLDLALTAGPEEIGALATQDKFFVTLLRERVTRTTLVGLSGPGLFAYGVGQGMFGERSVAGVELGDVVVDGPRASATAVSQGQTAPDAFEFALESGHWKLDLLNLLDALGTTIRLAAADAGQSEQEAIFGLIELSLGRPVDPRVWDRPGS